MTPELTIVVSFLAVLGVFAFTFGVSKYIAWGVGQ